jgi:hypothetical protein
VPPEYVFALVSVITPLPESVRVPLPEITPS